MDQSLITATLPLIGVAIGASLQYWFGRALEIKKQITLQKIQAYSDYFKSTALISKQGRTPDNLSFATDAKIRVCLYGSVTVVKHLYDLDRAGNVLTSPEGIAAITALLSEMRKDGGVASGHVSNDILRVVLLGTEHERSYLKK